MGTDALFLIVSLVEEPLQRHPRMSESDTLMVQLVVAFLRNIIAIPDKAKATGNGPLGRNEVGPWKELPDLCITCSRSGTSGTNTRMKSPLTPCCLSPRPM